MRSLRLYLTALFAAALIPSNASSAVRLDAAGVKDGGTLFLGTAAFDHIDPALTTEPGSPATSVALTSWAVEDATCATLLRYPSGLTTDRGYRPVHEVGPGTA